MTGSWLREREQAILALMPEENVDLIRTVYGFNWVTVADRERGLAVTAEVLAPDIEARISPEVGDRTLHGLREFAIFVQGLEEDFSEFRYDAEGFREPEPGHVVVTGRIRARGRRSNMPLTAPFGHVWKLRGGKAVSVEAQIEL
jgi:ketosteroid isomerase-like protein